MLLDALLVSLSASDTQQRLRRAFGGMDGGVCGPFGRHLGVLRGIGSLVEYRDLKPRIVLLSGCTVAVLAYIFRSQRVTLRSFSQRLPYIYSSPFRLPRFIISRFNSTFRAFGSPNGSKRLN